MGNCDFKKSEPTNNAGISKVNFQMHYVIPTTASKPNLFLKSFNHEIRHV